MLGINRLIENDPKQRMSLEEMEKTVVNEAYTRCDYNISAASKELGLPRSTLYSKLRKFQLIA
jgi:transcriptional regulator of acetoin/glycerol metabolism